jgi:hypothetical protein
MATAATDVTHVTPAVTVDLLEYVRGHLASTPPTSWARYQAAVGVSERTLYNIRDGKVDPGYSKVKKLYECMTKAEAEAGAQ